MGYTAPPLSWYHYVAIIGLAALYSGGSIAGFFASLVVVFVLFMTLRTFSLAGYSKLLAKIGE